MMSTSLIDTAYTTIRKKILTCEYMPGSLLSVYKLAEELEMSRTPISNAIARLELEGLVVALKNRGVMIKEFSSKEIVDMIEVFIAHQLYALDLVQHSDFYEFKFNELKDILNQLLKEKEHGSYLEYSNLSFSFTRSFIATAKNNVMLEIMDDHRDKMLMSAVANYKLFPQQRYTGAHYNKAIYDTLIEGNYKRARQLLNEWRQKLRERVMMTGSF